VRLTPGFGTALNAHNRGLRTPHTGQRASNSLSYMPCNVKYTRLHDLVPIIGLQVCAMWHPETEVQSSTACATIKGVDDVKPDRLPPPHT